MEHTTPSPAAPPAGIDPAAPPAKLAPLPAPDPAPEEPEPEPEFGYAVPEYDPAQYRWVPVRRVPRADGWTEEKQRRFIEALADTGLVSLAAKEVGMTRMSAYRLRRAPYAGAFARAWDVARERAGTLIEDIAFERAIEGVEQDNYNARGELAESKRVYNDRLLTFLLSHLKPERYSREARLARVEGHFSAGGGGTPEPAAPALAQARDAHPDEDAAPRALTASRAPHVTLDEALRAMEPVLPAPVEDLVDPGELEDDLLCAEMLDGKLPQFHNEQRPAKSPERVRAEAIAAQMERGRLASEKYDRGEKISNEEFVDWCVYLDPQQGRTRRRKPRDENQRAWIEARRG